MELRLSNVDVFRSSDGYYFKQGDGYLLKLSNQNDSMLDSIISELAKGIKLSKTELFTRVTLVDNSNRDEIKFDQLISTLLRFDVVKLTNIETVSEPRKTIFLINEISEKEEIEAFSDLIQRSFSSLSQGEIEILEVTNMASINSVNLCLVVVMTIGVIQLPETVSDFLSSCYADSIPIFHCSLSRSGFDLGPLIHRSFQTPCSACFRKRQVAFLNNPDHFVGFTTIPNLVKLGSLSILKHDFLPELIRAIDRELTSFFCNGHSAIMAKSIKFNLLEYTTNHFRLLKVHSCPVCTKPRKIEPFVYSA